MLEITMVAKAERDLLLRRELHTDPLLVRQAGFARAAARRDDDHAQPALAPRRATIRAAPLLRLVGLRWS